MNTDTLALFSLPGNMEWLVILVVALLIFGKRLPDVARSVGKSITEFKKGIREVKDDIEVGSRLEPSNSAKLERKPQTTTAEVPTTSTAESPKESSPVSK